MKKKLIKLLSVCCVIPMLVSVFGIMGVSAAYSSSGGGLITVLSDTLVGHTVSFGEYNGYPMAFYVAKSHDIDGDGKKELFLISEHAITLKAFNVNTASSSWRDSTLRAWLNSSEVNDTNYNEPGFLTNFSTEERNIMVKLSDLKTSTYSADNKTNGWGGTWVGSGTLEQVYNSMSYDTIPAAGYQSTEDTVFIPSLYDLYNYGTNVMFPAALKQVNITNPNSVVQVWLRDGINDASKPRHWYNASYTTINCAVGDATVARLVQPCFWINADEKYVVTGDGSNANVVNSEYFSPTMHIRYDVTNESGNFTAYSVSSKYSKIGKWINFGTYNGEKMQYFIAAAEDVNNDGKTEYLAVSRYLPKAGTFHNSDYAIWSTSTLRTWLNNETDGFMKGMTELEKSVIVPVTNKSAVPKKNIGANGGGLQRHEYNSTDRACSSNFDFTYYETTVDKVFIPSTLDYTKYGMLTWAQGEFCLNKGAVHPELVNSDANLKLLADTGNPRYFLRDVANDVSKIRLVNPNTDAGSSIGLKDSLSTTVAGVRPYIWLDLDNIGLANSGTVNDCYEIIGGYGANAIGTDVVTDEAGATKVTVTNYVYNNTAASKQMAVIVAAYSGDGSLAHVKIEEEEVPAKSNHELKIDFTREEGLTYRAFSWALQDIKPLCNWLDIEFSN